MLTDVTMMMMFVLSIVLDHACISADSTHYMMSLSYDK